MKQLAVLGLVVLAGASHAAELYNNGPVTNILGRSVLKAPSSTLGFGAQTSAANAVADDFTVTGGGWTLTDIDFFAYQTGANSFTFTDVTWSIVAGDVNNGSIVASGTTAVTNGGLVGYRVTQTTRRNKDRPIYDLNADIADVALADGTYWLRWSITGSGALAGPWQPPTSDGATGNAQQAIAGSSFAGLIDAGSGKTVELPFLLNGTVGAVPEPATWVSMIAGLALVGALRRRKG